MSWLHSVDRFSLDPCLKTCPGCDCDFYPSVRFVNGMCPACARERELAELAEEELADAMEAENDNENKENAK